MASFTTYVEIHVHVTAHTQYTSQLSLMYRITQYLTIIILRLLQQIWNICQKVLFKPNQSLIESLTTVVTLNSRRLTLWRPLLPYGTAIEHPVPDRVKPSFAIFDIRALSRSGLSVRLNSGRQRVKADFYCQNDYCSWKIRINNYFSLCRHVSKKTSTVCSATVFEFET